MPKKLKDGEKSPKRSSVSKKKLKADEDDVSYAQSEEEESIAESSHRPLDQEDDLFSPKKTKKKSKEAKEKKKSISSSGSSSVGGLSKEGSVKKKKKKDGKSVSSDDSVSSLNYMASSSRRSIAGGVDNDDESMVSAMSNRSLMSPKSAKSDKKKKTKKKVKEGGDTTDGEEEASVSSKKSKRGGKRESSTRSRSRSAEKSLEELEKPHSDSRPSAAYSAHRNRSGKNDDDVMDLQAENEALQAETVALRRQLNDALEMLDDARSAENQFHDSAQVQQELQRYKNEIRELQAEVDEYEEAVTEKDGLIKKLTEAVDCQLDKVEYLELKLQRAEEEFCKMEDELKDMEDEIVSLRANTDHRSSPNSRHGAEDPIAHSSNHSTGSGTALRDVADDMQRRLLEDKSKRLDQKEMELQEREADIYDREQDLLDREQELVEKEKEILLLAEEDLGAQMDQIRIKELRLQERERELNDMEDRIDATRVAHDERELELERRIQAHEDRLRDQAANDAERSSAHNESSGANPREVSGLKTRIEELDRKNEELEESLTKAQHEAHDATDMVSDLKERIRDYQVELADLKAVNEEFKKMQTDQKHARQAQHDLVVQSIHEGNKKQIQELYEENRKLQAELTVLTEQNAVLKDSIPDEGVDLKDFAMTGLQDEIAGLREKIVAKEREAKALRGEIDRLKSNNDENATEIKDLEAELVSLVSQLKESKESSTKKMAQKDETISFMQNEMIRIMKEKSEVDKKLAEKELVLKKSASMPLQAKADISARDDEAELEKIQAFNDQLSALDAENRRLQENLDRARIEHEMELKSKEAKILEMQEELTDLNWEIKARKEADYVSLLKDRKERKKELESTKKELMKSEERIADLERELKELRQNQEDLEKDVEEMNKSLVARDSGDYVSGLKRQIRSLKEHNMALERKIEIEAANSASVMEKNQEEIKALAQEIQDLKNPAQVAVRGMFAFRNRDKSKDVIDRSITTRSTDYTNDSSGRAMAVAKSEKDTSETKTDDEKEVAMSPRVSEQTRPPTTPGRPSSLWSAIISPFGSRRNVTLAPPESLVEKKSPGAGPIQEDKTEASDAHNDLDDELEAIRNEAAKATTLFWLDKNAYEEEQTHNSDVPEESQPVKDADDSAENEQDAGFANVEETIEMVPIKDPDDPAQQGTQVDISDEDDESLETADDIDTDDDIDLNASDDEHDGHDGDSAVEDVVVEARDVDIDSGHGDPPVTRTTSKEKIVFV